MRKERWLKVAAVFSFWILFGLYSAVETHYRTAFSAQPLSWGRSLYVEASYSLSGLIFTPLIFALARRFRLEQRPYWRNFVLHICGATVFAILVKLLWDVLAQPPKGWIRGGFTFWKLALSVDAGFDFGVGIYWLIVLMIYAVEFYQRYEAGLLNASQLQTQLVQAQLQSLRMQLHPHFLFNTLHTISALVQEDPEAAERTIARLSELLRISLESVGLHEIPLRQELDFLDLYLEIERTRFEDRLKVDFEIDENTERALVPNLVLQPLVENAIRHGVSRRSADGHISICAERQGGNLILRVVDNGAGLSPDAAYYTKSGVGLSATRGRLERLYGRSQSLILRNLATGGVEAKVILPYNTEELDVTHANHGSN